MSKRYWTAHLACAFAGCASLPSDSSVQAGPCVSTQAVTLSGLGADTEISASGRYVAAGDSLIYLSHRAHVGADRPIRKLPSHERSVFSTDDVLFTTSGATVIRYRWDGGWVDRERFTLGDGAGIFALLSSVGPYDVQRKGEAAQLVGFSAPSGNEDAYKLVKGDFGGQNATAPSEISFAGAHEVFASDEFIIVEAELFQDEMERVRRHHTVLAERQSSVCISGFVSCAHANGRCNAWRITPCVHSDLDPALSAPHNFRRKIPVRRELLFSRPVVAAFRLEPREIPVTVFKIPVTV